MGCCCKPQKLPESPSKNHSPIHSGRTTVAAPISCAWMKKGWLCSHWGLHKFHRNSAIAWQFCHISSFPQLLLIFLVLQFSAKFFKGRGGKYSAQAPGYLGAVCLPWLALWSAKAPVFPEASSPLLARHHEDTAQDSNPDCEEQCTLHNEQSPLHKCSSTLLSSFWVLTKLVALQNFSLSSPSFPHPSCKHTFAKNLSSILLYSL